MAITADIDLDVPEPTAASIGSVPAREASVHLVKTVDEAAAVLLRILNAHGKAINNLKSYRAHNQRVAQDNKAGAYRELTAIYGFIDSIRDGFVENGVLHPGYDKLSQHFNGRISGTFDGTQFIANTNQLIAYASNGLFQWRTRFKEFDIVSNVPPSEKVNATAGYNSLLSSTELLLRTISGVSPSIVDRIVKGISVGLLSLQNRIRYTGRDRSDVENGGLPLNKIVGTNNFILGALQNATAGYNSLLSSTAVLLRTISGVSPSIAHRIVKGVSVGLLSLQNRIRYTGRDRSDAENGGLPLNKIVGTNNFIEQAPKLVVGDLQQERKVMEKIRADLTDSLGQIAPKVPEWHLQWIANYKIYADRILSGAKELDSPGFMKAGVQTRLDSEPKDTINKTNPEFLAGTQNYSTVIKQLIKDKIKKIENNNEEEKSDAERAAAANMRLFLKTTNGIVKALQQAAKDHVARSAQKADEVLNSQNPDDPFYKRDAELAAAPESTTANAPLSVATPPAEDPAIIARDLAIIFGPEEPIEEPIPTAAVVMAKLSNLGASAAHGLVNNRKVIAEGTITFGVGFVSGAVAKALFVSAAASVTAPIVTIAGATLVAGVASNVGISIYKSWRNENREKNWVAKAAVQGVRNAFRVKSLAFSFGLAGLGAIAGYAAHAYFSGSEHATSAVDAANTTPPDGAASPAPATPDATLPTGHPASPTGPVAELQPAHPATSAPQSITSAGENTIQPQSPTGTVSPHTQPQTPFTPPTQPAEITANHATTSAPHTAAHHNTASTSKAALDAWDKKVDGILAGNPSPEDINDILRQGHAFGAAAESEMTKALNIGSFTGTYKPSLG